MNPDAQNRLDWFGKAVIVVVLVLLAALIVYSFFGNVPPVPAWLDSWTKWTVAMVGLGAVIRGLAKGFRSLL